MSRVTSVVTDETPSSRRGRRRPVSRGGLGRPATFRGPSSVVGPYGPRVGVVIYITVTGLGVTTGRRPSSGAAFAVGGRPGTGAVPPVRGGTSPDTPRGRFATGRKTATLSPA